MARGIHPYRQIKKATSGWVVSLSTQVQRDVAQSKILNYLNKDWIEDVVMLSGRKDSYENGVIDYILVKNARRFFITLLYLLIECRYSRLLIG
jgi:hypothetical protein